MTVDLCLGHSDHLPVPFSPSLHLAGTLQGSSCGSDPESGKSGSGKRLSLGAEASTRELPREARGLPMLETLSKVGAKPPLVLLALGIRFLQSSTCKPVEKKGVKGAVPSGRPLDLHE